ncbi:MAG: hypothetical protein M1170_01755 [Patescibacteria group bacterium]|nr:hypothetical protein [Patescibacteria group bacterium]
MKFQEKLIAVQLRKRGWSYKKILTKIKVAKSTLSLWLRDVELTFQQKEKLLKGREKSRYAGAKARQRQRIEKTEKIINVAKEEAKILFKNPLFSSGLMLYWAEGAKSNESIKFSNSDPIMIKFMMKWFRDICNVPEKKIRIAVHMHELHCRKDIEQYWSKITNIPLKQFQKTYIKPTSLKHRKNILYNGTCSVVIADRDLFRKIQGWRLGFIGKFNIKDVPVA